MAIGKPLTATSAAARQHAEAIIACIGQGDIFAVDQALWLATDLEEGQLRGGWADSNRDEDYEEMGCLNRIADDLRTAVARMRRDHPTALAAKGQIVMLWQSEGNGHADS